jgi:hypothetical protein
MQYIDKGCIWLDFKILAKTIPSRFKGIGCRIALRSKAHQPVFARHVLASAQLAGRSAFRRVAWCPLLTTRMEAAKI